jgi:hypothetical protein
MLISVSNMVFYKMSFEITQEVISFGEKYSVVLESVVNIVAAIYCACEGTHTGKLPYCC